MRPRGPIGQFLGIRSRANSSGRAEKALLEPHRFISCLRRLGEAQLTDVNLSTATGSPLAFGRFNGVSIYGVYETYVAEELQYESTLITLSELSNSFARAKLWAVPLLVPSQMAKEHK